MSPDPDFPVVFQDDASDMRTRLPKTHACARWLPSRIVPPRINTVCVFSPTLYCVYVNLTTGSDWVETRTAKQYMAEHRGKVMVLQKAEGIAPVNTDFCTVESAGTHPTGLIVTAVFEHNRRQHLRTGEIRLATDLEIAAREG